MWLRNTELAGNWMVTGVAALCCLLLAGCGFTPLYGSSRTGVSVDGQLSAIEVAEVDKRIALRVRNRLISILSPPGGQSPVLYRLEIFPFESTRSTLVRGDADVRRKIYNLRVSYKLYPAASRKPLTSGSVLAVSSYRRVASEFANVRAKLDSRNRAAVSAADDIRIRLAAFFNAR